MMGVGRLTCTNPSKPPLGVPYVASVACRASAVFAAKISRELLGAPQQLRANVVDALPLLSALTGPMSSRPPPVGAQGDVPGTGAHSGNGASTEKNTGPP